MNSAYFKEAWKVWKAELLLVLALALVADPLAYYANLYGNLLYLIFGRHSGLPIYPWTSLTTYRPVALNYLSCFGSALKLYRVAEKLVAPDVRVVVNDPLMSIFSCKYYPKFIGGMAVGDWSQTTFFGPKEALRFLAVRLFPKVFVDLYGCVRTLDLPKYIWKPLVTKAIMVKDAGYIYFFNTTALREVREVFKYHKTVNDPKVKKLLEEVEMPYGLKLENGKLIPALYAYLGDYGVKGRTWISGKIYVDVDGKYEFYASPGIIKVIIDGKELKPTGRKVTMQDFVLANYLGSLNLTEGWHEIRVEANLDWVQLYWKTPYSCAPYPPSAARFRPN